MMHKHMIMFYKFQDVLYNVDSYLTACFPTNATCMWLGIKILVQNNMINNCNILISIIYVNKKDHFY